MAPRPYRLISELEGAMQRGELDFALALANQLAGERHRPLDLELALGLLPLIASRRPHAYDSWALRWLARWISDSPEPTIEQAAELAASLADLPCEPHTALETIQRACRLG